MSDGSPEVDGFPEVDGTPEVMVRCTSVVKAFEGGRVRALDEVNLEIRAGEFVAVMGPSGCGKSTLLNVIAALDRVDSGTVVVAGHDLSKKRDLDHFRASDVGLVFQMDNLLPTLTAQENVEVALVGHLKGRAARRDRARQLLQFVDLADRCTARPPELSGGERQRVAIARALANHPPLLLADEPTGRLDSVTGRMVLDLLADLHRDEGVTLVVVTHDPRVAALAERQIHMLDGRIVTPASE